MFPTRASEHVDEHIDSTPPLSHFYHFVEVLEDDCHSKQMEANLYESALDFYHVVVHINSKAPLPTEPSFQTKIDESLKSSQGSNIWFH